MSDQVGNYIGKENPRTLFVEGPFGAGKTTLAIETLSIWLKEGVPPERILVMVPQRSLALRYLIALHNFERGPTGDIEIRTLGGLAKDAVKLFWPLVAGEAGFEEPDHEPRFLTIETSQYAMAEFVEQAVQNGEFDAVSVSPQQIARQIIDNLGKAAIMGIDYRQVPLLLSAAWGSERPRKRVLAYQSAGRVAHAFRQHCLKNSLLDYSLQIELFSRLLGNPSFRESFFNRYSCLIVEHVEEESPLTHNLIEQWLPILEAALLIYEWNGGYRIFLGADPEGGYRLRNACEGVLTLNRSFIISPELEALRMEIGRIQGRTLQPCQPLETGRLAFGYKTCNFYPEMLDWVASQIDYLVHQEGIAPRQIVVLAPFLSDALRFSLGQKLERYGIPSVSHRPSRALRDEPAARCLLTLAALAHPHWGRPPTRADVAQALQEAIEGLDPVRAHLMAEIVYRERGDPILTPFARIKPEMQARITYSVGQRYDRLLDWLTEYAAGEVAPLDHFFRRLFDELLSRPGYGFRPDPEAGRVTAELIESAQKFRKGLFAGNAVDLNEVGRRYMSIVSQGLLAALYVQSWRDEQVDAVFMAPAYTFLMRNRAVDVQFWLDIGSGGWWELLDQPLTHPYILSPNWPAGRVWSDADEYERQQDLLFRIMNGLLLRCRKRVYLGISDLGEQGYEQRGPMLRIFQQVLRRHARATEGADNG
jgi:hypothetical protein